MAIRAMWNFNHLPVGTVTGANRFNLNSYDITAVALGYGTYNGSTKIEVAADGSVGVFIGGNGSESLMTSVINVPSSVVTDGVSPKSYFGFKVSEVLATSSGTFNLRLTINDLIVIAREDSVLPAKGTNFYLEVGLDRVKKEITIYVDGLLSKTMTDANAVAIVNAYSGTAPWKWGYHALYGRGGADKSNVSNFYFSDEVVGETESARQGPVNITPIVFNSAVGSGWTSSDAKPLLTDILTPYTSAASLTAPVIRSGDPYTDLVLGLDVSIPAGQVIKAAQFLFDGVRHAKTTSQPLLSVTDGTNSNSVTPFAFSTSSIAYGLMSGINTTAPDGGVWTTEKFKAAKLVVGCTI